MEIEPKDHILMQATFQNNGIDNSISKTINLKTEATEKDVYDAYMLAWKTGCKGTTVYRNGSKKTQVLKTEEYKEKETELHLTKRPNVLSGTTYKMNSGCGKLYITVNEKDGKPYEVFVQTAGNGGCIANTEALGRALSLCLRNEIPVTECIKQMSRVTCLKCKNGKTIDGKSCADIIGKCLSMGVEYENEIPKEKYETTNIKYESKCPECGKSISMMEGCMTCLNCGYSKCS
jgi:ribonucleoside-diphosphate reductase alpha chain